MPESKACASSGPRASALVTARRFCCASVCSYWAWSNYEPQIRTLLGIELPNDYEGSGNGTEVLFAIQPGDIGSDVARNLVDAGVTMTFDAFYDLLLAESPEGAPARERNDAGTSSQRSTASPR